MHPQQPYPPGDDRYQPPGQYANPYGQPGQYGQQGPYGQQAPYGQGPYGGQPGSYAQPYYGQPAAPGFSGWLKALAVTLSVLKAIPMLLMVFVLLLVGAVFFGLAEEDGLAEAFGVAGAVVIGVIVAIALILSFLLIGQAYTALKSRRTGLIVFGSILAAIDLGLLGLSVAAIATQASMFDGADAAEGVRSLITTGIVTGSQVAVVFLAVRSPPRR